MPLLSPMRMHTRLRLAAIAGVAAALSLLAALALFVAGTLHWPLVGDAPLLHYGVFLLRHGWGPYRQFIDPNLPGTYAVQALVVALFGYGALPWRLFDLLLLLLLGMAALLLLRSPRHPGRGALAALWVTTVFALEHGRDGLIDLGQRDLLMTVLLAFAVAAFCAASRRDAGAAPDTSLLLCGGGIGAAATVKPIAGLLLPALLGVYLAARSRSADGFWCLPATWRRVAAAVAGTALAPLAACVYLLRQHALGAFLHVETTLAPLHAGLFRKPLPHLLAHLVGSTMLPFILLALPAIVRSRPWRTPAGQALLAGFGLGALSFLIQGRGYPYHRYPSLFFLLLLCARAFLVVLPHRRTPRLVRASAAAALLISLTMTVPRALTEIRSFTPHALPFRTALAAALRAHGGATLSGHVQCFDMAGGCLATLLDLRLLPATGFLYDCYAFAPVPHGLRPEQQRYRAAWLAAMERTPPTLLIVTSDECGPHDLRYTMLSRWPELAALLQQHYALADEWTPSREENWNGHPALPEGFRLYALR